MTQKVHSTLRNFISSNNAFCDALKKDESKTSLFFCLINDKLGRTQTSINWLNKYLTIQNPTNTFLSVFDLIKLLFSYNIDI